MPLPYCICCPHADTVCNLTGVELVPGGGIWVCKRCWGSFSDLDRGNLRLKAREILLVEQAASDTIDELRRMQPEPEEWD
jgi:hypothetical protein